MPRDANGNYTLPPSYHVQTGDTLLPVQHNPPFEDVAEALTNSLARDGRTVMTGDLRMGGNKVTNVADPAFPSDAMTRRVSGFEFETRADAEAWPGVDPMPESIRTRGYAEVSGWSSAVYRKAPSPTIGGLEVSGTFYQLANAFISVAMFGAIGDGITDDGPAIQAAMDRVAEMGGGVCLLPPGVFMTGQELKVPSFVHLHGAGIDVATIKAMATLSQALDVITNKKNNKASRTDFDTGIHVTHLTVDGNRQARSTGTITAGTGSNITFSCVRDSEIGWVRSVDGVLHCFDIMASVYADLSVPDLNFQPAGPSLHISVHDCIADNPGYDDAFTTHNSGFIRFERCRAFFNRTLFPTPNVWQYGFEIDEGSYNCAVVDCYANGFQRAFASKGHPQSHGAQFNNFLRCFSDNCGQGFWLFHSLSNGTPNNYVVSIRDCIIANPRTDLSSLTDSQYLMEIDQTANVEISNLTLINPGDGTIKINGAFTTDVNIEGVHVKGTVTTNAGWTDRLGIVTIYGSLAPGCSVRVARFKADSAMPRPAVRCYDADGIYVFEDIIADGSSTTVALVHVSTVQRDDLCIRGLRGSGWAGLVYDASQSTAYGNGYRQEFGEDKFMTLAAGGPEGAVYAPAGTAMRAKRSGNYFKKGTSGNLNTGWTQIT